MLPQPGANYEIAATMLDVAAAGRYHTPRSEATSNKTRVSM